MTEEQDALRASVRALLEKHSDVRAAVESPDGYDKALWARLCDVGVLPIPEEYGGSGATLAESHVVLEELGRTLTPAPLLGSLLAVQALLLSGNDSACSRLLPRIASGTIASVVWADEEGRWDSVTGETGHYVLDGDLAEILLLRGPDGVSLHEVESASCAHVPTMDPTRRLATVTVSTSQPIGAWSPQLLDIACAALAREQVGAAARCLELTVEYAKTRVQFGRPIGSFQALKHRMADMHVLVETARSAACAAVDPVSSAVAKVYCSEAFQRVAAEMIQLHGGIAITWEHDAHLYFKRAHGSALLFGSPAQHLTRLRPMVP